MKINSLMVVLFLLTWSKANAQVKGFFAQAKVEKIDTVTNYLIIKVRLTTDSSRIVILSPVNGHLQQALSKKYGSIVAVGKIYRFKIQHVNYVISGKNLVIKADTDNILTGGVLISQPYESAYRALNMRKGYIYN